VYDGETGARLRIITVWGLMTVTAIAAVPTARAAYTVACTDYKGTLVLIDPYGTVEIRYSGMKDVYKTKLFRCQNSGTRL
jgi:hypothetical protein